MAAGILPSSRHMDDSRRGLGGLGVITFACAAYIQKRITSSVLDMGEEQVR
jgi:hypothetical protein